MMLSEELVAVIRRIEHTNMAVQKAAEKMEAATVALSRVGLTRDDAIGLIAAKAGVSKAAAQKVFAVVKQGIDAYDLLSVYLSDRFHVRRTDVRKVLAGLDSLVKTVQQEGESEPPTVGA